MEAGKPSATPVEQPNADLTKQAAAANVRMEEDPKVAARFAAQDDKIARFEAALKERDQKEKAKELAQKALEDLNGYQIGDKTKEQVAKFALQGEAPLKEFIAAVKEVALKDSPRSLYDAELAGAVKLNDPVVAKFAGGDAGKMEKAAKFASEWRTLKASPAGKGMRINEEEWITQAMKEAEQGGKI